MIMMMMMVKIIIMGVWIKLLIIITSIRFTIQMEIRVSILMIPTHNRIDFYRCLCRAIFCKIFARRIIFFFFVMTVRSAVIGFDGEVVVDEQRDQFFEVWEVGGPCDSGATVTLIVIDIAMVLVFEILRDGEIVVDLQTIYYLT